MLAFLGNVFRDLIILLVKILVVIAFIYLAAALLVAFSVIGAASATAWLGFGVMSFSSAWGLMIVGGLVLSLAFVIDPKAAQEMTDKIVEAIGKVAESAVDLGQEVVGGALRSFFGSPLGLALLGFGGVLLYRTFTDDRSRSSSTSQGAS